MHSDFNPRGNEYAGSLIRFKALVLSRRRGFARDDPEDIEQDLWVDLLERLPKYDPAKASLNTFIARVVERRIASLLRHHLAEMRSPSREEASLNELVRDAAGNIVERHETTPEAESDSWNREELERDIAGVLASLSDLQRAVAIGLAFGTVNSVGEEVGISRRAMARHMAEIRERFEDAGLRDYL